MKKFIIALLKKITYLIPKKNNRVCFKSFPDYSGNAIAVYEYMKKNTDYELIWLIDNEIKPKIGAKKSKSISGLWTFFRAKYIITTHNDFVSISPSNQIYISLWHGMPLKKIGYTGNEHIGMKSISALRISTSELTRSLISASFNEPANNVFITGQPVCDKLFSQKKISDFFDVPNDVRKVIFYLPTFRQDFNEKKIEGRKVSSHNIFRFDKYNHHEFIKYLEYEKILLIVKLHPAEECYLNEIEENGYFKFIKSKDIDLYDVLAVADSLITDYSSVYIDYLILDRPLAFVVPDKEQYIQSRNGFTLEPYDDWTPGNKIISVSDLFNFIDMLSSGQDNYKNDRQRVKRIMHRYDDDQNSKRVFDMLIKR